MLHELWIPARNPSSWPGLTVQNVVSSETTPETLPLPDLVVIWPFVVASCVAMVFVSSCSSLPCVPPATAAGASRRRPLAAPGWRVGRGTVMGAAW